MNDAVFANVAELAKVSVDEIRQLTHACFVTNDFLTAGGPGKRRSQSASARRRAVVATGAGQPVEELLQNQAVVATGAGQPVEEVLQNQAVVARETTQDVALAPDCTWLEIFSTAFLLFILFSALWFLHNVVQGTILWRQASGRENPALQSISALLMFVDRFLRNRFDLKLNQFFEYFARLGNMNRTQVAALVTYKILTAEAQELGSLIKRLTQSWGNLKWVCRFIHATRVGRAASIPIQKILVWFYLRLPVSSVPQVSLRDRQGSAIINVNKFLEFFALAFNSLELMQWMQNKDDSDNDKLEGGGMSLKKAFALIGCVSLAVFSITQAPVDFDSLEDSLDDFSFHIEKSFDRVVGLENVFKKNLVADEPLVEKVALLLPRTARSAAKRASYLFLSGAAFQFADDRLMKALPNIWGPAKTVVEESFGFNLITINRTFWELENTFFQQVLPVMQASAYLRQQNKTLAEASAEQTTLESARDLGFSVLSQFTSVQTAQQWLTPSAQQLSVLKPQVMIDLSLKGQNYVNAAGPFLAASASLLYVSYWILSLLLTKPVQFMKLFARFVSSNARKTSLILSLFLFVLFTINVLADVMPKEIVSLFTVQTLLHMSPAQQQSKV